MSATIEPGRGVVAGEVVPLLHNPSAKGTTYVVESVTTTTIMSEPTWHNEPMRTLTSEDLARAAKRVRKARGEPVDVDAIRKAHALAAAYHAERTARLWAHCRTITERRQESLRTVPAWVMGVGR